jgi:hypothetical protein
VPVKAVPESQAMLVLSPDSGRFSRKALPAQGRGEELQDRLRGRVEVGIVCVEIHEQRVVP